LAHQFGGASMPLWLTIAVIVLIAARWIIFAIDHSAEVIVERLNAMGRILESIEKSLDEIKSK
jgi:hypothetical protein